MLRGGPMMKMPGRFNARFGFSTDNRKKLVLEILSNFNTGFERLFQKATIGIEFLTNQPIISNFL